MSSLPPITSFQAFEAVARRRSFSLAAAELNLTPSAVSHQISGLETHLDMRLFERSAHGVRLSPAGEHYLLRVSGAISAIVMQHKTKRPVQFEITAVTREALQAWIKQAALKSDDFLFPSRLHDSPHLGTRQYARILGHWVDELGLDRSEYGTHSIRRTKATLIYRRTKNLRAVQLLLGHSKLESTVRYLGIEVDDALEISEQTEI